MSEGCHPTFRISFDTQRAHELLVENPLKELSYPRYHPPWRDLMHNLMILIFGTPRNPHATSNSLEGGWSIFLSMDY